DAEEAQDPLSLLAVPGRAWRVERIELEAARDRDPGGVGAELDQAVRRFLALHAEAIDVPEHAAEERADHPIARIRSRRDAAVDDERLDVLRAAQPQQVRP